MTQREAELTAQLSSETAIVNRVWAALGITTYAQAQGKSIEELVTALRQQLATMAQKLATSQVYALLAKLKEEAQP